MSKNLNRGEFYEDEFEALDSYGLKKGKVARIVHSSKKQRPKSGKAPETEADLEEFSRSDLLIRAQRLGIITNSKMGKKELIQAIKDHI